MNKIDYIYKMHITDIYDGDSCTANVDVGFKSTMNEVSLRLNRIDTPECRRNASKGIGDLHVKAGKLVRDFLRHMILDTKVIVQTFKDNNEKYGRYLCEIWVDGLNVNNILINLGYAKSYHGGKKKYWSNEDLNHIIKELQ